MKERKILQTREFMRLFLTTDVWDDWFLAEATVTCANVWTVDGHVNRAYYEDGAEEAEGAAFSCWSELRPFVFSLIRGKRTPLSFRFLLQPPREVFRRAPSPDGIDAAGAEAEASFDRICRIRFAEGCVYIASAVSMKVFTLDKEPERVWDEACSRFLDAAGISFEEL